ncbi:MAG: AfsR/SARP family transcriptional regulator, partial [Omnitrophica WOR_2 bacterium]
MSSLLISLLGHPEIVLEGKTVRLETRKSLAILAYLSLQEREIPREVLAAMFWAEFDQQHSQANLRRNIGSLNEKLNFAWIASDREVIALKNRSGLWLDVEEFNGHLNSFRDHGCEQKETCQLCSEHLRSAVKLYRGDFLEGFNLPDCPEFDDWQFNQRETWRSELAFALE